LNRATVHRCARIEPPNPWSAGPAMRRGRVQKMTTCTGLNVFRAKQGAIWAEPLRAVAARNNIACKSWQPYFIPLKPESSNRSDRCPARFAQCTDLS
jgi:hypothetical protein